MLDSTMPGETRSEVLTPETIDAETGEPKEWRTTGVMASVVEYLRAAGESSQSRVEGAVKGRASTVREAIGHLITDGVVRVSDGPRGSKLLSLADLGQPMVPTPSDVPTPSHPVPDEDNPRPDRVPRPPLRGDGGRGHGRGRNTHLRR